MPIVLNEIQMTPTLQTVTRGRQVAWLNPHKEPYQQIRQTLSLGPKDIQEASDRLLRFAPYIAQEFPETQKWGGLIESELVRIPQMQGWLRETFGAAFGNLYMKCDNELSVAGSIKARGGIYEVLCYAERLAMEHGLLRVEDDYRVLSQKKFRDMFSRYTIQVGSTGNLGLSIGIISAHLGFKVFVHMSKDAQQWKKDKLRAHGVTVVEYQDDYCAAIKNGRLQSSADPYSYFVDDESSKLLFLGYSVAAQRLKVQLQKQKIPVDREHPLFVYLPCGVGGAPGGITFGLKELFGDDVHCFFAEPTQACCMLVGLLTGRYDKISVQDIGLSGSTCADGLAVSRASTFVGRFVEPMLSGIFTLEDKHLFSLMRGLMDTEGTFIEPSSCASFAAALHTQPLRDYCECNGMTERTLAQSTHIAWATGGSMVPKSKVEEYRAAYL